MGYFHLQRTSCAKELFEDVKKLVEKKQKKFGLICAYECGVEERHDITLPDKYHSLYPDDELYLNVTIKIKIK